MGIISDLILGNTLTKLTNFFVDLSESHKYNFIGAGGGIDSLPKHKRELYERKVEKWIETLKKHPRHVVTRELIKNMQISKSLNRMERARAQLQLLEFLINEEVALNFDDFEKSYL
ncbi:hypothetical protein [Halomonas sp. I5-271120]|uniref:hypothetical protein n=1 Tax=Halomonas sp. I5-271120 TaxID=3061632 RepID=UPI00271478BC|nr:hypothetical protein [Halomonas sp. I5-271120]